MEELINIKKTLKKWESAFIEENDRKPGKADMHLAPQDITDAYKRYKELKQTTNQADTDKNAENKESNDDETCPKAEVWGRVFDKKNVHKDANTSVIETKRSSSTFLQNLGQKMFEKSQKLNIQQANLKSIKQQWRKPDTPRRGLGPNPMLAVPEAKQDEDNGQLSHSHFKDPVATPTIEQGKSDETSDASQFQMKSFGKFVSRPSLSSKENKHEQTVFEAEPFMGKFQTKSKLKPSVLPQGLSKLVSKHKEKFSIDWDNDDIDDPHEGNMESERETKYVDEVDGESNENVGHSWHVPVKELIIEDMAKCDKNLKLNTSNTSIRVKSKSSSTSKPQNTLSKPSSKSVEKTRNVKHYDFDGDFDGESASTPQNTHSKQSSKSAEKTRNVKHYDFDGESADHSEQDGPVINKDTNNLSGESDDVKPVKVVKKVTRKRKPVISSDNESEAGGGGPDENLEEDQPNVKKRKGKTTATKPASKKQKLDTGEALPMKPDSHAVDADGGMNRPVAKRPTKTKAVSNDNFIRLNMKVKKYQRKGGKMSGGQYKRQMWKQKMKDRSKSYGDACFKCGQSGHWANKCKGNRNQSSANKEPVLDEDFPSMQEAAEMARGIRLEQKKPKPVKSDTVPSTVTEVKDSAGLSTVDEPDVHEEEEMDVELEIQSGIVRTRRETAPVVSAMEPLLDPNNDINELPDFVVKGLKLFGYDSFRPGQKEAVMRILSGQSTLVVLSTGGGKSLCYQLPAYLYAQKRRCLTLVISPLVSLMEDQVTGLPNGVRGVCLHTNMTTNQREKVLSVVKEGNAQFLLVSPEAIAGGSMTLISSMATLPPVAFVCIDEAHCLSEWSHNFRPSYLRLCKVLRERLGVKCFLGLTATATLSTAADVSRHLNITDFKTATVRGSPIPSNLQLSVSRDENKEQALVSLLQGDRFCNLGSIIIYCTRRDQTDKVATMIRTCLNKGAPVEARKGRKRPVLEWDAESYHAGLTPAARKRVQNAFMSGKLRVVAATVAFGMGLDKADVRGVIHYNMPKSFESYVQEIGRAGRDGNLAQCHVFLDAEGKDLCELRRHTYANTVDYKTLKKLVLKIFAPCRCREVNEKHAIAAKEAVKDSHSNPDNEFDDITDAELIEACESDTVKEHEGETKASVDDTVSLGGGVGRIKACEADAVKGLVIDPKPSVELQAAVDDTVDKVSHEGDVAGTGVDNELEFSKQRLCPGHERALPIEQTVMELDVKEEGISTLLCYLELHSNQWLENLPSVYANCKLQCYEGPAQLHAIAKKCPPVAVAIAKARREGKNFTTSNSVEFPVVEISDCMGWDSGPVKKELKLLQWDFNSGTAPKRTGVMIEFTDLSYHFRSCGDFTSTELDDILEFLHKRVQRQEKTEIQNLSKLYKSLKSVSHKNYWMCADSLDTSKNDKLKVILNDYFDTQYTEGEQEEETETFDQEPTPDYSLGQVISDVRQFANLYGQEHTLSGRAVARIFHGIASPCFPAQTWGRVRRYWRSHLNVDFNELMKVATRELIQLRR